ncbi:P-loop containing nucleoside triphosphate hydrolase protein [Apodospora peruviana]|uniref:small monomeric GTPase n=1 Tax=Apodospora peruviana TaxID=516989 RepID=A0AAE0MAX9_9PEZI|nr:P-loop containing nucleoside triphosphate hydrolase protein [Apodospora peruviana]
MVNSFVWTDEETKYLKAVFKWKEDEVPPLTAAQDERREGGGGSVGVGVGGGGRLLLRHRAIAHQEVVVGRDNESDVKKSPTITTTTTTEQLMEQPQKPAGEFRILVIGAKGTGKTSILTRFAQGTFPGEGEPPDPFYERGCRHRIELDASLSVPGPIAIQTPAQIAAAVGASQQKKNDIYVVDALEMPSRHLPSNPMLEQALNITEAGVLVYDVRDPKSLQLCLGIAEFVREYLNAFNYNNNNNDDNSKKLKRRFPLILVGNKSDVDDEQDRAVSWAEGAKAASVMGSASSPGGQCPFVEVSAKTGDNIDVIFPRLARDILKLKWLSQQQQQRTELAERRHQQLLTLDREQINNNKLPGGSPKSGSNKNGGRKGFWKALTTPFLKRQQQSAY